MKKPITHTLTAAATAAVALSAFPLAAADNPKSAIQNPKSPNVIFLLADDMGYGDIASWGDHAIRTPNIDRLVAEGVRIDQFYVAQPICSPSRVGFTTGQFPQRWRITSFLEHTRSNAARGMDNALSLEAPTLARCLQNAGYATGHFGKWHMGGQRDFADAPLPTEYGFDASLTQFEGLGDRILPVLDPKLHPKWPQGRLPLGVGSEKLGRGKCEYVDRWQVTRRFVDRAIDFIGEAKKSGKPFYINLWSDDPHTPVEPSPPFRGDYSDRTRYHGVVHELDRDFGRLIDHIRNDPDLRDNTIIVFASDNGPEQGFGSNGNLRGYKGQLYEGGVREPFVLWAPNLTNPGRNGKFNTTSIVSALDFAPTILALTGVKPATGVNFDGRDMSKVVLGYSTAVGRPAPLFWARPPDRPGPKESRWPDYAMRDGDWKLYAYHDGHAELYNIAADPGEMYDKAKDNAPIVATMTAALDAWKKDVNYEHIYKPSAPNTPGVRD